MPKVWGSKYTRGWVRFTLEKEGKTTVVPLAYEIVKAIGDAYFVKTGHMPPSEPVQGL